MCSGAIVCLALMATLNSAAPTIGDTINLSLVLHGKELDVSFDKGLDARISGRLRPTVTILLLRSCTNCALQHPEDVVDSQDVDYVFVSDSTVSEDLRDLDGVIVRNDLMMEAFPPVAYARAPVIVTMLVQENGVAVVEQVLSLPPVVH